jgi:hypothetical protein
MSLNNFLENKCEDKLNSKFIELEQKIEYKLNSKLLWLELKYEEKIEELEEKYEEKINNKLMELEQKYEEKINNKLMELKQMLNSKINDISLNCIQKNDLDEGKLELKLMVLEQNYENRLNTKINDIKNNMVTQGDLDDMSFHCAQINPIAQVVNSNVTMAFNHMFNSGQTQCFWKCTNCVYNLYDNNNLCQYCRPHMINISGIRKLKKKNHLLISGQPDIVNVIRINKKYYWLCLNTLLLFNYVPIPALDFHRNIQGLDVIVRKNNGNDEYEKMIDNPGSPVYFGFGSGRSASPVFYEVGRIDKLTKKVTFHNYN